MCDRGRFPWVIGSETIRPSGDHSRFVVETFDRAAGNLALGAKPIEQEFLMGAKHAGNFFHRLQSAAQGAFRPVLEKSFSPERGFVSPEMREGFLQLPGPGCRQFADQQRV